MKYGAYNVNRPACWADENASYTIYITNEGRGPAKDVDIRINQGSAPGAIVGSSVKYYVGTGGAEANAVITTNAAASGNGSTWGQCVTGAGFYRWATANMYEVDLQVGDTLFVTWETQYGCDCRSCDINYMYFSIVDIAHYTDNCDIPLTDNIPDIRFPRFDAKFDGFFEGESQVSGSSACVNYTITSGWATWFYDAYKDDYPNAYFESRLSIGKGVDFTGATITYNNGTVAPVEVTQNSDNNATGNDEVKLKFDGNVSGQIELCFDKDCDEAGGSCEFTTSMSMQNYFFPDPSCQAGCEPNVSCEATFPFLIRCPDCGPCAGISFEDLNIERTNFSFADVNGDNIPDGGGTVMANATTASGDRFVQGDSLKVEAVGVVSAPGGESWEHAFFDIDVSTSNYTILGAEYKVYDASAGSYLVCNTLSQSSNGTKLVTDLSIGSITGLGCSDFAGYQYEAGDWQELNSGVIL